MHRFPQRSASSRTRAGYDSPAPETDSVPYCCITNCQFLDRAFASGATGRWFESTRSYGRTCHGDIPTPETGRRLHNARASARTLHSGQAGHLRLPCLPAADPSAPFLVAADVNVIVVGAPIGQPAITTPFDMPNVLQHGMRAAPEPPILIALAILRLP